MQHANVESLWELGNKKNHGDDLSICHNAFRSCKVGEIYSTCLLLLVISLYDFYFNSTTQAKIALTNASGSNGWRSSTPSPTPTNFTGIPSSSTTLTCNINHILCLLKEKVKNLELFWTKWASYSLKLQFRLNFPVMPQNSRPMAKRKGN